MASLSGGDRKVKPSSCKEVQPELSLSWCLAQLSRSKTHKSDSQSTPSHSGSAKRAAVAQWRALVAIRTHHIKGHRSSISRFRRQGGLQPLLGLIQQTDCSRKTLDLALSILGNCCTERETSSEVRKLDGINIVVEVMRKHVALLSIQNRAARVLANLAVDPENSALIHAAGGVPLLLLCVSQASSASSPSSSSSSLSPTSSHSPPSTPTASSSTIDIPTAPCTPPAAEASPGLQCAAESSPGLQCAAESSSGLQCAAESSPGLECAQSAARALFYLCDSASHRLKLVSQGAVALLCPLLSPELPQPLRHAVFRAVHELSKGCGVDCARQMIRCGALSLLGTAAMEEEEELALKTLANVCSQGCLRPLVGSLGVITKFCAEVKKDGARSIPFLKALCLCCKEAVNRAKVKECGGLELLTGFLASHPSHPLSRFVIQACVDFVFDEAAVEQFLELGLVPLLVERLVQLSKGEEPGCSATSNLQLPDILPQGGLDSYDFPQPEEKREQGSSSFLSLRSWLLSEGLISSEGELLHSASSTESDWGGLSASSPPPPNTTVSAAITTPPPSSPTSSPVKTPLSPSRFRLCSPSLRRRPRDKPGAPRVATETTPTSRVTNETRVATETTPASKVTNETRVTSRVTTETTPTSRVTNETRVATETTPASRVTNETRVDTKTTPTSTATNETKATSRVLTETMSTSRVTNETTPASRVTNETGFASKTTPASRVTNETTPASRVTNENRTMSRVATETTPTSTTRSASSSRTCTEAMCHPYHPEPWTAESPLLLLLSRFSHVSDPSAALTSSAVVSGLLLYLTSCADPSSRCSRMLLRLSENPLCLQGLVRSGAVALIRYHLCDREERQEGEQGAKQSPRVKAKIRQLGLSLLTNLQLLCESGFGTGVLSHLMLSGSDSDRLHCALSLPLITSNKSLLRKLLLDNGGLQFALQPLGVYADSEQTDQSQNLRPDLSPHFYYCPLLIGCLSALIAGCKSASKHHLNIEKEQCQPPPAKKTCFDQSHCPYSASTFDLTFLLDDGTEIPANHSAVSREETSDGSDYFRALLKGGFGEAQSKDAIPIRDVSDAMLKPVLHYLHGCRFFSNNKEVTASERCQILEACVRAGISGDDDFEKSALGEAMIGACRFLVDGLQKDLEEACVSLLDSDKLFKKGLCKDGLRHKENTDYELNAETSGLPGRLLVKLTLDQQSFQDSIVAKDGLTQDNETQAFILDVLPDIYRFSQRYSYEKLGRSCVSLLVSPKFSQSKTGECLKRLTKEADCVEALKKDLLSLAINALS